MVEGREGTNGSSNWFSDFCGSNRLARVPLVELPPGRRVSSDIANDKIDSEEMSNAKACACFTFRDCHWFSIRTWRDGRARQPGRYKPGRYREFACRQSVVVSPPLLGMAPRLEALQSVALLVVGRSRIELHASLQVRHPLIALVPEWFAS